MALELVPRTELEAVNSMLLMIGEQPVNSLESEVPEALLARSLLHNVSREVQSMGLLCNTEENYSLIPDSEGFIYLPKETLFVDAVDKTIDIVQRGNRLYDRLNHTFIFDEPVKVNIVFFLQFEDLPQSVREYITIKAARQFQNRVVSSETLFQLTAQDEQAAWINLLGTELDSGDYSLFDSFESQKIINR